MGIISAMDSEALSGLRRCRPLDLSEDRVFRSKPLFRIVHERDLVQLWRSNGGRRSIVLVKLIGRAVIPVYKSAHVRSIFVILIDLIGIIILLYGCLSISLDLAFEYVICGDRGIRWPLFGQDVVVGGRRFLLLEWIAEIGRVVYVR